MVFLHMLTIFPHTNFYHTIDFSIGFPSPYFSVTTIQHVLHYGTDSTVPWKTRKQILLLHSMEVENTELDSLESLVLDPRP